MLTLLLGVAKDSDASLGTRASAAKDAVGDKVDEEKNSVCFFTFYWMILADTILRLLPLLTRRLQSTRR